MGTVSFGAGDLVPNELYLGDNLQVLRSLPSKSVDLIYIDPPFFSGRNYNLIWGDDNELRTFGDIWEDGLPSYLEWLNARLWEMARVLKGYWLNLCTLRLACEPLHQDGDGQDFGIREFSQ